ncbi:hypothetical protein K439DRAFT_1620235 [Ramaria rubella]|nr:hypothetical protein K439DRAFT_1620235 [Ramaria rubella]
MELTVGSSVFHSHIVRGSTTWVLGPRGVNEYDELEREVISVSSVVAIGCCTNGREWSKDDLRNIGVVTRLQRLRITRLVASELAPDPTSNAYKTVSTTSSDHPRVYRKLSCGDWSARVLERSSLKVSHRGVTWSRCRRSKRFAGARCLEPRVTEGSDGPYWNLPYKGPLTPLTASPLCSDTSHVGVGVQYVIVTRTLVGVLLYGLYYDLRVSSTAGVAWFVAVATTRWYAWSWSPSGFRGVDSGMCPGSPRLCGKLGGLTELEPIFTLGSTSSESCRGLETSI